VLDVCGSEGDSALGEGECDVVDEGEKAEAEVVGSVLRGIVEISRSLLRLRARWLRGGEVVNDGSVMVVESHVDGRGCVVVLGLVGCGGDEGVCCFATSSHACRDL